MKWEVSLEAPPPAAMHKVSLEDPPYLVIVVGRRSNKLARPEALVHELLLQPVLDRASARCDTKTWLIQATGGLLRLLLLLMLLRGQLLLRKGGDSLQPLHA